MKRFLFLLLAVMLVLAFAACSDEPEENPGNSVSNGENISADDEPYEGDERKEVSADKYENAVEIVLSKEKITVDGKNPEESDCVTVGGEIIYYHDMDNYQSGNKYGNGTESDKHTEEEAAEHTLVTITKPGEYFVRGELKGQLAIDLGDEAEKDPNAKVTLILGGVDINCEIAPAVIFYNVYECETLEAEPTAEVDTTAAGANVIIADESVSNINGANVAKIYKDNSDEKKLHKYDGAFYSKMTMNIDGEEENSGVLNVNAENEGIDSEMHLTINGGIININSKDDGINTNEDGISVTTINGGKLTIVGGTGTEGDGIDSNGWIVINGGEILAFSNERSGDGGIDSDNGTYINGGKVLAFGSRSDGVSKDSKQLFATIDFKTDVTAESIIELVSADGKTIRAESERAFRSMVISDESFTEGSEYSFYVNGVLQEYEIVYSSENIFGEDFFGNFNFEEKIPDLDDKRNSYKTPEGLDEWMESEKDMPEEIRSWIEAMAGISDKFGNGMEMFGGDKAEEPPMDMPKEENPKTDFLTPDEDIDRTIFVITKESPYFSGVSDSEKATGKESVSFTIDGETRIEDIYVGDKTDIKSIECSKNISEKYIKLTLMYTGRDTNKDLTRSCLLSDGYKKVNELFNDLPTGDYRLIVEVTGENENYRGIQYFSFDVLE